MRITHHFLLLALLSLVSFGGSAYAASTDIEINTTFEPLKPDRVHAITTAQVLANLQRSHYESQRIDDRLSSKIFDILLKDTDPTRSYFLASDIADFEKYRHEIDNALLRSDLQFGFLLFNRLQQRTNERLSFLLTELNTRAQKYTFDGEDVLDLDRENATWANNSAELDVLWRKRLQNSLLNLILAGREQNDSIDLLRKRYQNQLNRLHQSKSEDAYQTFMNAVTRAFDPHTQYLSPRNTENFNINMSLSLQGIGAVLQSDDEYTKILRLVPAGPADKAGTLAPADRIVGVGQEQGDIIDVIGWRLDEVVELIRGPKGSTVRLEVLPANSTGPETRVINIVREEVKLEEQSAQKEILTLPDGENTKTIGVIDIPTFYIDFQGRMENRADYRSTTRDVKRLIEELMAAEVDGIIIDLRNNGGGSLEEAISLTGLFIPGGPVVQVRSTLGRIEVLQDLDSDVLYSGPLTVLVNRLSASASEIFAGAMQDYGRAIVVGGQTFGKGTVQSLRPLGHGQLKITQAKFYRVSGDSTQHQGVIPDILYPSLFDQEKIGESALNEALAWDSIRAASFRSQGHIRPLVPQLKERHIERSQHSPDFNYLRAQKAFIEELRQQTVVSLNQKIRDQERKANQQKRLDLENRLRKAKGQPLLTALDDDGEHEETENDTDKNKEPDALLLETAHVLLDLMTLKQPARTAQQQAAMFTDQEK